MSEVGGPEAGDRDRVENSGNELAQNISVAAGPKVVAELNAYRSGVWGIDCRRLDAYWSDIRVIDCRSDVA